MFGGPMSGGFDIYDDGLINVEDNNNANAVKIIGYDDDGTEKTIFDHLYDGKYKIPAIKLNDDKFDALDGKPAMSVPDLYKKFMDEARRYSGKIPAIKLNDDVVKSKFGLDGKPAMSVLDLYKKGMLKIPAIIVNDDVVKSKFGLDGKPAMSVADLYKKLMDDARSGKKIPAINVNDSVTKSKFDNLYGIRVVDDMGIKKISSKYNSFYGNLIAASGNDGQQLIEMCEEIDRMEADMIKQPLHMDGLDINLTDLSKDQSQYLGLPVDGPYKPDHYRY